MPITLSGVTSRLAVLTRGGPNSVAMLVRMAREGIRPDIVYLSEAIHAHRRVDQEWGVEWRSWIDRHFPGRRRERTSRGPGANGTGFESGVPSLAWGSKSCAHHREIVDLASLLRNMSSMYPEVDWVLAEPFDADESDRADRRKPEVSLKGYQMRRTFPLIQWNMGKKECWDVCTSEGLKPVNLVCFQCPSKRKDEIACLALTDPDEMAEALRAEDDSCRRGVFGADFGIGGRGFRWRTFLEASPELRAKMPEPQPRIPCECYDG